MKNKAIEKGYQAMESHRNVMQNRLYQVNQKLISHGRYEIDKLTEIIDTVMNGKVFNTFQLFRCWIGTFS